jgi:predicted amidohydrolase
MPIVAAVQMTSSGDVAANLEVAEGLIERACAQGANLVALPENFAFMGPDAGKGEVAEALDGPILTRLGKLALARRIHLLAGSILEAGAPGGRLYNTSVLLGPGGERLAAYRKIHLFDVAIPDGATYRESEAVAPGKEVVVVPTELAQLGLSICYDLRFPELYRRLSRAGAQVLFVPAAFTYLTGQDHWEVLLRARAIENLCFVVAPAQVGAHSERRRTWGHAMVIDPWGRIRAQVEEGAGLALAELDLAGQARMRTELPALGHRVLD